MCPYKLLTNSLVHQTFLFLIFSSFITSPERGGGRPEVQAIVHMQVYLIGHNIILYSNI